MVAGTSVIKKLATISFMISFTSSVHVGHNPNKVQFYIFSDRIVSSQYQMIASYGIIGLYISVVFVIFKFVRFVLIEIPMILSLFTNDCV